jgi:branched-chain amino acid transport system permease protein
MVVTSLAYFSIYKLLIRRLLYDPIMVAVITVLFNLVLEYIFTLIFSRAERILFPVVPGVAQVFGTKFHKNMFLVLALSLLIMVGFLIFVKKTFAGMSILALSMDRKGAVLSGVNPDKTLSVVYLISGLMAGLSGVNYGAYTAVYPEMFLFPFIIVLSISLIGGLGSVKGTIIGSLIIGFLEIITTYLWDPKARGIAALFAIIVILYIRPRGLFGREVKF